jgi:outer membrane cobalamin receptor
MRKYPFPDFSICIGWMLLIINCLLSSEASSQTLSGKIYFDHAPVPFAGVSWLHHPSQTQSDSIGKFSIPFLQRDTLLIKAAGFADHLVYVSDTNSLRITLTRSIELKGVEVYERGQSLKRSGLQLINTETIGKMELKKAACCNLAESFETNATVDVVMSDGVSGARQLSMLGLDGIYTQINTENIPYNRGAMASFGVQYIPGTWIRSIDISKGSGSVVNGYEPISGTINVEFLAPEKADRLSFNAYQNSLGRSEINLNINGNNGKNFMHSLFMHGSSVYLKNDINQDGFLDIPLEQLSNIFYRAKWSNSKWMTQVLVRNVYNNKTGGEWNYEPSMRLKGKRMGMETFVRSTDVITKTALLFPKFPARGLGFLNHLRSTQQELYFGYKNYSVRYQSFQSRLIYQDFIVDTRNTFQTGLSFVYDNFNEVYNDSGFRRTDPVSGGFFEFTRNEGKNLSMMAGIRVDYHPVWKYWLTPKVNIRYNPKPKTTLRFTAGSGTRIANPFLDNTSIFASSRKVLPASNLQPERAFTAGFSLNQRTSLGGKDVELNIDVFETRFVNQVLVDFYESFDKVSIYNLDGASFSRSIQADVVSRLSAGFEARLSYKWYQIISTYRGLGNTAGPKPMIPLHRLLLNLSYYTDFEKWRFDFTTRYMGKSRMPVNHFHPSGAHYDTESLPFFLLNTQINRKFKHAELYAGAENLLNFVQPRAIISAENPFSQTFDASMIYAPLTGRVFYIGFTYIIP